MRRHRRPRSPLIRSTIRILGISTLGRGSAVALLDESSVLFAIEEEKLNRLQDSLDLPRLALERCLRENRLQLSDCRAIAVATRFATTSPPFARGKQPTRTAADDQLRHLLRGGPRPSRFDHHLCHAASAYYTSGFNQALAVTLDQGASSQSGLVALGEGDELRPLQSLKFPDSLGWFYPGVTGRAGLRPRRDEHKLQWLSKDGHPEFLPVFRKLFAWRPNGLPALNRRYFRAGPDRSGIFFSMFFWFARLRLAVRSITFTFSLSPETQALLSALRISHASSSPGARVAVRFPAWQWA